MDKKKLRLLFFILFTLFFCTSFTFQDSFLEYKARENRYEGVRSIHLKGNGNILLLSMKADYQEKLYPRTLPPSLKLKLYIGQPNSEVYITVRELNDVHHYLMDQVKKNDWKKGWKENVFEWPTDIIKELHFNNVYEDLGAVARLDEPHPKHIEKVAPLFFYHSKLPPSIDKYMFVFKTIRDARISWSVYKMHSAEKRELVYQLPYIRLTGDVPFVFRWDCSKAEEGLYELVGKGYFRHSEEPLDYEVSFYHNSNFTR